MAHSGCNNIVYFHYVRSLLKFRSSFAKSDSLLLMLYALGVKIKGHCELRVSDYLKLFVVLEGELFRIIVNRNV